MALLRIPEEVLHVCHTLRAGGYEAFVVGGGVRDALLGIAPKDWDVATSAPPRRVQQLFRRTVATGIEFGTITVLIPSGSAGAAEVVAIEVTTFRGESGYADGRRPDEVHFIGNITDDLVRRDFTVNAIAYEPFHGSVIDPFDGRSDLGNRCIRAVGDADERFKEDALRILRAVRLATELSFDIAEDTAPALRRNAGRLAQISRERIGQEWRRIVTARKAGRGLQLLARFDLLPYIFVAPGDDAEEDNVAHQFTPKRISRIAGALDRLDKTGSSVDDGDNLIASTAIVLHGLGSPAHHTRWLRDLVYSRKNARAVLHICRWLPRFGQDKLTTDEHVRRFLSDLGRPHITPFFNAWSAWHGGRDGVVVTERVRGIVERGDPLSTDELALQGGDIIELLEISPGPVVGQFLQRLLNHVLAHPDENNAERLTALLLDWANKNRS